jgi:hypothetical protein
LFTGVYFVFYTLVSLVLAAAATGMGEGSTISLFVMGSPLSAIIDLPLFPLPGLILGALLIFRQRRVAAFWLLIHYVGIPIAIWRAPFVDYSLEQLHRTAGGTLAFAIFYLLGNIFAWMIILRRDLVAVPVEG